jgi:hypothetical protein
MSIWNLLIFFLYILFIIFFVFLLLWKRSLATVNLLRASRNLRFNIKDSLSNSCISNRKIIIRIWIWITIFILNLLFPKLSQFNIIMRNFFPKFTIFLFKFIHLSLKTFLLSFVVLIFLYHFLLQLSQLFS